MALTSEYCTLKGKADESCCDEPGVHTETLHFIFFKFKSKYLNNGQILLITSSKCPGCPPYHQDYCYYYLTYGLFLYQWRLPATPAQGMSVLWTTEFLNSRIHVDSRRLIRNQKQNNRDALIYSASSSRNIDPRTMSVMEGILQNGATFTEWTKQWVQAAQVFWIPMKLLFHPLLLSPRRVNVVTVADPKVQFPQRLLPFPNKGNPLYYCTSQCWGRRLLIPTGEREGKEGGKGHLLKFWTPLVLLFALNLDCFLEIKQRRQHTLWRIRPQQDHAPALLSP